MKRINILLFENFETLDVFGPVEAFGMTGEYDIHFVSLTGGIIANRHGVRIETEKAEPCPDGIWLIPGGGGTRPLAEDPEFITALKELVQDAEYILTVCTGSALLARTGLLNDKNATSNKLSFAWVQSCGEQVKWNREARWVKHGNVYTSAGVSAGTDMALGFIADRLGREAAETAAKRMEYHWNTDPDHDIF